MSQFLRKERNDSTDDTPPLLTRKTRIPRVKETSASHMTVVTTQGNSPEMHDQQEDRNRS